ncbi:MAG: MTAP family purine nucleoside phosphorylase [Euryarchaeota archaeon]|nr:MTAP family purine nucleoside phosphorylase [Euryarchaeota archaeon]
MKIGLLCGHRIPDLLNTKEILTVETKYGSIPVEISPVGKHIVFFINRHGPNANLPPHMINYRGNIAALAASHVDYILSVGTVGSLHKQMKPGDIVIPHDFIDFTKTRPQTFFESERVHVDMTNPYCPLIREQLLIAAKKIHSLTVHDHGVYLATEGPRLETISEIKFFSQYADVVGMTGVPEVILAREKSICYASLCLVSNMAAGLQSELSTDTIKKMYTQKQPYISKILTSTITNLEKKQKCSCKTDISKAKI